MWNQSKLNNQGYGGKNSDANSEATSNLWVGNLAMDVTETDLMILFQRQGAVDNVTLYSSRSYAFVSYKRLEDAMAAKDALQGTVLRGQSIKIDFAKPARPSKSLWVGGIGPSVLKEELEAQFLKFGKIEEFKFFRDRNTALVDYVRLEDASQALKVMNGTQIGDGQIRVDFLRSNPSRREHSRDPKEGQFFSRSMGPLDSQWLPPDFKRQQHSQSLGGLEGDGQPSNVLCISYPPVVHIDEQMLHNAMILFGEIEGIRSVPLRHCSFVEFRSVEEARRAKEGLQGKLFNDPRILITYSSSELAPSKMYPGFHPGINGPRPDMFANEIPFRPPQMDLFNRNQSMVPNNFPVQLPMPMRPMGPQGSFEPLLPHPEFNNLDKFGKLQNTNPNSPMGGPSLKRLAPLSGFLPSHSPAMSPSIRPVSGNWDVFDANQPQRESKRSRTEDPSLSFKQMDDDRGLGLNQKVHGVGPQVDAAGDLRPLVNVQTKMNRTISPSDTRVTSGDGLDYAWRGVIAKGGTPVCRARCVPIGEGIRSEIPEVVNCSARTGLDMLTKHYADAVGFDIIFFLPDSEEDFAPYTEFLRFLGAKNRAGVAKFDDGTTLFLVPPSDFLTKVLNVAGPERLYGVVLNFHQHVPSRSSARSLSPQPRYIDNRLPQTDYHLNPREEIILQQEDSEPHPRSHGPPSSEPLPMYSGPPTNTAASSQAGLTLTPELIAALTSFLPPKEKSPASTPPAVLSDRRLPQGWQNDHNAPELTGHQPVVQQVGNPSRGWQNDHNAPEPTGHHPMVQQVGSPFNSQLQAYQNLSQTPLTAGPEQTGHQLQQLGSQFNPRDYQNISPTPRELPQRIISTANGGIRDHRYEMPQHQGSFSSRPSNNYASQSQSGQFGAYPQGNQQYYHEEIKQDSTKSSYGGDAFGLYSPSNPDTSSSYNQFRGANASSQLHNVNTVDNAEKSNLELPNQVQQQLQSALYGAGQSTSGPEIDKNELYKSTLQFAANLLLQVQQKQQSVQGTQAGQGSGNQL